MARKFIFLGEDIKNKVFSKIYIINKDNPGFNYLIVKLFF